MIKSVSLSSVARDLFIVISDKNKSLDTTLLENWLKDNCVNYCYILHDKDTNDDGELKLAHWHILCSVSKRRVRLSTQLNSLSKALNISPLAISIDKADNFSACFQYLIHKNHPLKYQYSINDIVSNFSFDECVTYMSSDINCEVLNFDTLKNICACSMGSRLYIMENIGIGYYAKYRNVINDILAEINQVENNFKTIK